MTLDEAIRQLTLDLKGTHVDPREKLAPTGEAWQTIVSGGALEAHDDPYPLLAIDEEQAVYLWLMAVIEYARDRTGPLYWCGKPELRTFVTTMADWPVQTHRTVETRHAVYSRLLISAAPIL